jgi:hypothetical protein
MVDSVVSVRIYSTLSPLERTTWASARPRPEFAPVISQTLELEDMSVEIWNREEFVKRVPRVGLFVVYSAP